MACCGIIMVLELHEPDDEGFIKKLKNYQSAVIEVSKS
jgi:hypothetical protein